MLKMFGNGNNYPFLRHGVANDAGAVLVHSICFSFSVVVTIQAYKDSFLPESKHRKNVLLQAYLLRTRLSLNIFYIYFLNFTGHI